MAIEDSQGERPKISRRRLRPASGEDVVPLGCIFLLSVFWGFAMFRVCAFDGLETKHCDWEEVEAANVTDAAVSFCEEHHEDMDYPTEMLAIVKDNSGKATKVSVVVRFVGTIERDG
jgi:hypothetical protein